MRDCLIVLTLIYLLACEQNFVLAQADSTRRESITKRAFRAGINLISTNPGDTITNEESTNDYVRHSGKIIRAIIINRVGFETSIYDSSKKGIGGVTRVAKALHKSTRNGIIQKHLFMKPYTPLNPHMLADNERFLRDKDFILDSRIIAIPVEGTDSVDIAVITRDVFSLGATLGGSLPTAPRIGVYDANVDGRGQRIEFTALLDQDRAPKFGYALLYRKSSVFGSLANLELGYTQLNSGVSIGDETEFAFLARLDRPLVSPYTRLAGGLEISRNWSENVYRKPDSVFLNYNYRLVDTWLGYNLGIHRRITDRNRYFMAVRFFDGYYIDQTENQDALSEVKYNDAFGYLGEITYYKRDFYKTRYIFGFGRTEDVPHGISVGVAAGYLRLREVERPYSAVKFDYSRANKRGDIYQVQFQAGGYFRNHTIEDAILRGQISYFTKLLNIDRYKMRHYISAVYSQLFNQMVTNWLEVNKNDIPGFTTDSLEADKRVAVHLESVLYTPWSILGFRFAPFTTVDMAAVKCVSCSDEASKIFWGLSGGIRTRNENLIFGTIELKFTYIPSDEYGNSKFVVGFKQNLRVKNTGSFVNKPSLVSYN